MAWPPPPPTRGRYFNADPARLIRCSIAMLLRLGIGLSLLSNGLTGYFGSQRPGGPGFWGQAMSFNGLEPFLAIVPYVSIGLGLALILGFMSTPSSIAAGFFSLLGPVLGIIQIVYEGPMSSFNGMTRSGNNFFTLTMMSSMPTLLNYAALIWLSPLENHPFSVDAMIFGRNVAEPPPIAPVEPPPVVETPATIDN